MDVAVTLTVLGLSGALWWWLVKRLMSHYPSQAWAEVAIGVTLVLVAATCAVVVPARTNVALQQLLAIGNAGVALGCGLIAVIVCGFIAVALLNVQCVKIARLQRESGSVGSVSSGTTKAIREARKRLMDSGRIKSSDSPHAQILRVHRHMWTESRDSAPTAGQIEYVLAGNSGAAK